MKTIRRLLLCVPLLTVLGVMTAAPAARADDGTPVTQDDTRFWQVMTAPTPPTPNPAASDTEYWQQQELLQDYQQLHP